ncbi:poly(A) RNA polymerase GLD2 [Salarias fasciatus]|uniref:polynucleotide adenylyltransferase n=1 Tax=Salarias fasciatus TaxID=181472 RepID=A0A672HVV3_SALFA|nr:poly(A) RNA polymerase GLD2 [Salarias fasciatus]
MFPHSAAPWGRGSNRSNSLYPRPPLPPLPPGTYNNQGRPTIDNFHGFGLARLPPYQWKSPPSTSTVVPQRASQVTGRKRQLDEQSQPTVKRQRLDLPSHPAAFPDSVQAVPPPRHPDPAVPASSKSFPDSFDSHPSSPFHPHPPSPVVPSSSTSLQAYAKDKLSDQMVKLFEACQQQTSDLERKELCRFQLQEDIRRVFAVATLYLTGSSMNGLGCRSSDADLCLVIKGHKRVDAIHVLSQLQQLFRSLSYVEKTQLIRAKVPILRFRKKGSDLEFDLNVNNTVGIRNTFLLRSYANADLRIRPLILVIKKWARHNQINDASKGTLSSYTLVLMVLHYLQTLKDPVLPSLQKDFPDCFDPYLDLDEVPDRATRVPPYLSKNQSSLGELLLGFLKYYATEFRWEKQVISVREARSLPKADFQEWRHKYICIEEPFERNNVARAVHEQVKFDAINDQFFESWRILQRSKDLNSILPVRMTINKESFHR